MIAVINLLLSIDLLHTTRTIHDEAMDAPKPVVESDITLNRVVDPDVKLKAHQYDHSKAFVLCWMWFADLAINNPEDPKADCSLSFAAEISSDFSQKIKERDYTAQSIENYYRQARMNAETANLSWDSMAVAMILVTLLTKLGSCDRFSGPLDLYVQKVSIDTPLSFREEVIPEFAFIVLIAGSRLHPSAVQRAS